MSTVKGETSPRRTTVMWVIVLSLPASYPWKKLWHEAAHGLGALVT